ncbi:recombinase family protein [Corynebacterium sp. HMSC078A10]|uniref:recombinase family protein n=1 Tax=Corynebacterium sp. HMSC078A10 TaxID=1739312 RepID=UPI00352A1FFE
MGYARVSTTDQNPERQHTQLKAAGAVRIYTDHQSGLRPRAPAGALRARRNPSPT